MYIYRGAAAPPARLNLESETCYFTLAPLLAKLDRKLARDVQGSPIKANTQPKPNRVFFLSFDILRTYKTRDVENATQIERVNKTGGGKNMVYKVKRDILTIPSI